MKGRAADKGMSLSDFLKRELERVAERPSMREWLERTREAKPIAAKRSAAQRRWCGHCETGDDCAGCGSGGGAADERPHW